jgi:hypothetical protein
MDPSRFDNFARSLALTRRGAVKAALGGAAAGVAALVTRGTAGAKPKPFQRVNKRCDKEQPCGELTNCEFGICRPKACEIRGTVYQPRAGNPANPCQECNPDRDWEGWSDRAEGASCPPPNPPQACKNTFVGTCKGGACVPLDEPDDTPCGDTLNPCVELTCQSAACQETPANDGADCDNGTNGVCVDRFGSCLGGICVGHQEPDGSNCEGNNICCHGDCIAAQQCGDPDPGGGCQGDECSGTCRIDGVTYNFGDHNPANNCQVCTETSESPTIEWRPALDENTACGAPPVLRACCNGECCASGECCGEDPDGAPRCTSACLPPAP